jgi:hypothetical protein
MTEEKFIKALAIVVFLFTGMITLISFALSYGILWDVALAGGKSIRMAWAWPLIIDLPIIVFSLVALFAIFLGYQPYVARMLVVAVTALTIYFNYNHATTHGLSWPVTVTAPIMYFISFEVLAWMVKIVSERSISIRSIGVIEEQLDGFKEKLGDEQVKFEKTNGQLKGQLEKVSEQITIANRTIESYRQDIEAKKAELKRLTNGQKRVYAPDNLLPAQRQQVVLQMIEDGLGNEVIADSLGVSVSTIKGDKRMLKETMNGQYPGAMMPATEAGTGEKARV